VATGRILLVHESAGTRALLADLLSREGLDVEAVDSTYACIDRFVDAPADVVVVGLADVDEVELDLIPALKREERPPRVLVTFPGPRREMAVRALSKGADGYVLEPFYRDEVVGLVRGQLAREAGPYYALSHLAREVAHAVNNPLQVVALLLMKDKVTRQELLKAIPEQTARIEAVVRHLREFGAMPASKPEPHDVRPLVEAAGIELEPGAPAMALVDPATFPAALGSLREAVLARVKEGGLRGQLRADAKGVTLRIPVPPEAFAGEDVTALLDSVFVVSEARDVLPGLALARALLESQHATLAFTGDAVSVSLTPPAGANIKA
jgi:DNA-binding response OmpR family regulator